MPVSDRPRLVVADDHPHVLEVAIAILTPSFDVVASVPDGAAAIDAALRLQPDAVVLDISMPGLDGFQTATRLKATCSDARVVFLSNHIGEDFVLAGMARGASAFVAKTRMPDDLVTAVHHALAGRAFVPTAAVLPRWRRAAIPHDLQLYATDAFLADAVTGFLENALDAGDAIGAIATASHLRVLSDRMTERGLDVQGLIDSGRYSTVESESAIDALLRDGAPDPKLFAAAFDPILERALTAATGSPARVSLFGELAPLLYRKGQFDAALSMERIAHTYTASRPLSLLCGYPTTTGYDAGNEQLACVCAEHSTIVAADGQADF